MKPNFIFSLIILFFGGLTFCQSQSMTELEVDNQVWDRFKEAYRTNSAELYNSIHTDQILRITPDGIRIGEEYRKSNVKSMGRPNRTPRTIDFVFQHRIHKENIGYEVGYYRVVYYNDDEPNRESYGRFHVLLKKENGHWKIALDWDSDDINGTRVTAKDFERLQGH